MNQGELAALPPANEFPPGSRPPLWPYCLLPLATSPTRLSLLLKAETTRIRHGGRRKKNHPALQAFLISLIQVGCVEVRGPYLFIVPTKGTPLAHPWEVRPVNSRHTKTRQFSGLIRYNLLLLAFRCEEFNPREKPRKTQSRGGGGRVANTGRSALLNHSIRYIVLLTGKKAYFLFPGPGPDNKKRQ